MDLKISDFPEDLQWKAKEVAAARKQKLRTFVIQAIYKEVEEFRKDFLCLPNKKMKEVTQRQDRKAEALREELLSQKFSAVTENESEAEKREIENDRQNAPNDSNNGGYLPAAYGGMESLGDSLEIEEKENNDRKKIISYTRRLRTLRKSHNQKRKQTMEQEKKDLEEVREKLREAYRKMGQAECNPDFKPGAGDFWEKYQQKGMTIEELLGNQPATKADMAILAGQIEVLGLKLEEHEKSMEAIMAKLARKAARAVLNEPLPMPKLTMTQTA